MQILKGLLLLCNFLGAIGLVGFVGLDDFADLLISYNLFSFVFLFAALFIIRI